MSNGKRATTDARKALDLIDDLIEEADAAVADAHKILDRLSNEVEEQRDLVRKGSVVAFETPAAVLEWIGDRLQSELDGWE